MAELEQVFDDVKTNTKKLVKSKPFLIAAGVVALVALYVWWRNSQSSDSVAYDAVGYGGYPTLSGGDDSGYYDSGSGSGSDSGSDMSGEFERYVEELNRANEENFSYMMNFYDSQINDLYGSISMMSEDYAILEEENLSLAYRVERDAAVSQMRANSELYNTITDRVTKDALHAENLAIAEAWGFTFDPSTGNYFDGNSVVYTTAKQQAGYDTAYTGGKSSSSSSSFVSNKEYNQTVQNSVVNSTKTATSTASSSSKGYDANVDYSLAIKQAKESGASESTIKALETARQAKINDVYGGVDPAKKTTTTTTTKTTATKSASNNPVTYATANTTNRRGGKTN